MRNDSASKAPIVRFMAAKSHGLEYTTTTVEVLAHLNDETAAPPAAFTGFKATSHDEEPTRAVPGPTLHIHVFGRGCAHRAGAWLVGRHRLCYMRSRHIASLIRRAATSNEAESKFEQGNRDCSWIRRPRLTCGAREPCGRFERPLSQLISFARDTGHQLSSVSRRTPVGLQLYVIAALPTAHYH